MYKRQPRPPDSQVHLCGSFTNWLETVPMAPEPTPGGAQVFAVVCNLPPGYHQYKFIVDGEWRHDENQAFIQDPLGNVNNWLFVKKPGSLNEAGHGATQQQGIPIPQHSPAAGAEEARATRERGDAGGSRRRSQNGEGAGMDWVDSMGQMQIKRDVDGVLKPAVSGMTSAMGVKGVGGAVPDGLGSSQDASRARVLEFLQRHTAYELIPESNKVVVLDTELPVRRAFHACYEQGITAAPLWDERAQAFVGMLSAGDFIDITQIIGSDLAAPAVSEQELDAHTIAAVRQSKSDEGKPPAPLVSVRPEDSLHLVSLTLMQGRLAMAPVLSFGAAPPRGQTPSGSAQTLEAQNAGDENGGGGSRTRSMEPRSAYSVPQLLHLTNLAEVLACLVRHFRGVPSALPLFAQPIGALPIGTWTHALGGFRGAPDQPGGGGDPSRGAAHRNAISDPGEPRGGGVQGALAPLKTLTPTSSVASAFELMPGCGALPVVDEHGRLVDVYARADVILLAANHTYRRVALSEFTVAQALAAGRAPSAEAQAAAAAAAAAAQAAAAAVGAQAAGLPPPHQMKHGGVPSPRAHTCTRADSLRAVVEALALPGVRRLVAVDAATGVVEGVVSLSDVVAFLLAS